jgi:putative heme-binding domain-containing protein
VPRGATFAAEPLLEKREIFASSDDWCRPVFLTSGPDGALYFCDMYRKIIEHPDYLPEEIRKHSDFDAGKTQRMGRIWRITRGAHSEASGKRLVIGREVGVQWEPHLRCAEQNALNAKYPPEVRALYVNLLGRFEDFSKPPQALFSLVGKEPNAELRNAAVRALATFDNAEAAAALLAPKRLAALTPLDREVTVSALLARPVHAPRVLEAVESGVLPRNAVSAAQRTALSKSKDAAMKARAEKLFGAAAEGDRMKAYEASKAVLALAPKAAHGKEVFKTICSSCHRLDQEGYNVGPDLLGMRNQPKESILLHIVVPDYEIIAAFAASNIELKDGRILAGIIISTHPSPSRCARRSAWRKTSRAQTSRRSPRASIR